MKKKKGDVLVLFRVKGGTGKPFFPLFSELLRDARRNCFDVKRGMKYREQTKNLEELAKERKNNNEGNG